MFRLGKWVVFGLAVWMLAAQEAKAGVGFLPVSPDELKLTSEPQAPGAPAISIDGRYALTNSFELAGSDENDKKLVDEKIEIV